MSGMAARHGRTTSGQSQYMGKPESEEDRCRKQAEPPRVPSFEGDPAPWDFQAFGRRLADIMTAAIMKGRIKR